MKFLVCVLSMIFLVPVVGLAQDEFIFFYDFNGEEAGDPPSEPWKVTAAGEIVVEEFPSAENKSVRVTDNGSGGGMTLILDPPITGKTVSLEFKWLVEESSGSDVEMFYVLNQKCADDWRGACIAMVPGKNATLEYHDGGWIHAGGIEAEVWHDFKLVMHLEKLEYDLYYDDEEIVKNATFRDYAGIDGIDKFNVGNVGNGGTTFVTYFDDIVLYEGDTRPSLSVAPMFGLTATWGSIKRVR
jgi:hypothetical protein